MTVVRTIEKPDLTSRDVRSPTAPTPRNGLDLANAALYFQVREELKTTTSGYNHFFAEWDAGTRNTPAWGETKDNLIKWPPFTEIRQVLGSDALEQCHAFFYRLSAFTHGRPWDKMTGEATSNMNMGSNPPAFDADLFSRFAALLEESISWICAIWLIAFPEIARRDPLATSGDRGPYLNLLGGIPIGVDVLNWALSRPL